MRPSPVGGGSNRLVNPVELELDEAAVVGRRRHDARAQLGALEGAPGDPLDFDYQGYRNGAPCTGTATATIKLRSWLMISK